MGGRRRARRLDRFQPPPSYQPPRQTATFCYPSSAFPPLFGVCARMHASGCKQGNRDAVMHTMPTESRHGAREMLASFPQAARLLFHGRRGGQLACSRAVVASRVAGAHKAVGCTRSAARRCRIANGATSSEKPGQCNRQAVREPGPWPAPASSQMGPLRSFRLWYAGGSSRAKATGSGCVRAWCRPRRQALRPDEKARWPRRAATMPLRTFP